MEEITDKSMAILFMKVGSHAGESIKGIIKRKQVEEQESGLFFWGYNSNLCNPLSRVKPFIEECMSHNLKPKLLMHFTDSKHHRSNNNNSTPTVARYYSKDKKDWRPLPNGIFISGSRYALVCKNLKEVNMNINLNSYRVAAGRQEGKPLGSYIQYQVDRACAFLDLSDNGLPNKPTEISYVADIVEPWAVFVSDNKQIY